MSCPCYTVLVLSIRIFKIGVRRTRFAKCIWIFFTCSLFLFMPYIQDFFLIQIRDNHVMFTSNFVQYPVWTLHMFLELVPNDTIPKGPRSLHPRPGETINTHLSKFLLDSCLNFFNLDILLHLLIYITHNLSSSFKILRYMRFYGAYLLSKP